MSSSSNAQAPADQVNSVRALFDEYDKANEALVKAKEMVEKRLAQRSDIVKSILETTGKKKLTRKLADGKVVTLTIVKRGEIAFFRGSADEAFEV